jgi:hypothetical protein
VYLLLRSGAREVRSEIKYNNGRARHGHWWDLVVYHAVV